jgi:hypothetical protein
MPEHEEYLKSTKCATKLSQAASHVRWLKADETNVLRTTSGFNRFNQLTQLAD